VINCFPEHCFLLLTDASDIDVPTAPEVSVSEREHSARVTEAREFLTTFTPSDHIRNFLIYMARQRTEAGILRDQLHRLLVSHDHAIAHMDATVTRVARALTDLTEGERERGNDQ
jgi:hypothetical protein